MFPSPRSLSFSDFGGLGLPIKHILNVEILSSIYRNDAFYLPITGSVEFRKADISLSRSAKANFKSES